MRSGIELVRHSPLLARIVTCQLPSYGVLAWTATAAPRMPAPANMAAMARRERLRVKVVIVGPYCLLPHRAFVARGGQRLFRATACPIVGIPGARFEAAPRRPIPV